MNIFQAYLSGLRTASRSLQMTTLIYAVNLTLGIVVAIPFFGALKRGSANSLSIHTLLKEFDFTVLQEFFSGGTIHLGQFVQQGFWIVILFFIISIFITGGILHIFSDKAYPFTMERFFNGGRRFFPRFLRMSLYMLVIHAITAVAVYLIVSLIAAAGTAGSGTEKQLFYIILPGICFHLVVAVYLLVVADYARFIMVRKDSVKVLRSMWESTRFVTRRFPSTYGLYLMLIAAPLLLGYLYILLSNLVGMTSGITILAMFIVQQVFIWTRVFTRIWTFGSQFDYYLNRSF